MGAGLHGSKDSFFLVFSDSYDNLLEGEGQNLGYSKGIEIRHFGNNSFVLISTRNIQVKSPLPFILQHQQSCAVISSHKVFTSCSCTYNQGIINTELLVVIMTSNGHNDKKIQRIRNFVVSSIVRRQNYFSVFMTFPKKSIVPWIYWAGSTHLTSTTITAPPTTISKGHNPDILC